MTGEGLLEGKTIKIFKLGHWTLVTTSYSSHLSNRVELLLHVDLHLGVRPSRDLDDQVVGPAGSWIGRPVEQDP